jgi:FlgD Ig-like domain
MRHPTSRVSAGAVLFFVLLAAAVVAAVLVVRARTPDLVLEVTSQPSLIVDDDARISFFVRESDDRARVAIVDRNEDVVRTLDPAVELTEGEEVSYEWDRSTDAGGRAPPGRYRLLVELPSEDREMVWPRRMTLAAGFGGGD